jgi:UDP-N-acetylglucosamine enolpyruvyl transferase
VVASARSAGFGWVALSGNGICAAGARSVDALTQELEKLCLRIRAEVGAD